MSERLAKHLDQAVRALALGDRSTDTLRPSRRAAAATAALAAYGEGVSWALTAESEGDVAEGSKPAWAAAPPELLAGAADAQDVARAKDALARGGDDRAISTDAEREADLEAVRGLLRGLIRTLQRRHPSPRRLARRRWVRAALVAALALSAIAAGATLLAPRNLAAGKRWTVSSAQPDCEPHNGMCQGEAVSLLFHTRHEESPWVRVDLGRPLRVSSIVVTNRPDCCEERAVPLILEVSSDQVQYTTVAERTQPFSRWKAAFPPVTARYVRARVPRATIFHLESIVVR